MNYTPQILIVDDTPENVIALQVILEDLDVHLITASSGNEAVKLAFEHDFALILMDVQMPEMDGFEAVKLIKQEEKNSLTPVIFLSAVYSHNFYHIKGAESGAIDFISKPFTEEILLSKVNLFLKMDLHTHLLEKQKDELASVNKKLEDYTHIVSHDLKEPLRNIKVLAQFIYDDNKDKLTGESKQHLDFLIEATGRMSTMVSDLLKLSKVGRKDIHFYKINPQQLLSEIQKDFKQVITERNVSIVLNTVPQDVVCQPVWIKEVFANLISNSIKYNESLSPIITITHTENTEFHTFTFADNGIGVAPEYCEKIFDLFKRLHGQDTYEGTGAGLAIVKQIIQEHQGAISAKNREDEQGLAITFSISKKLPLTK